MADKNSRLNLVQAQQSNKETVINSNLNALSPSAFGGRNEQASVGLIFGLFGGAYSRNLISNSTVTLNDNTENNYVYFNTSTLQFGVSNTEFGDNIALYKVTTSNGMTTNWIDYREIGGSGGGGGSDPNFVSNQTPTVAPTATGTESIAIGTNSKSQGIKSITGPEATATGNGAISFGDANKANSNYSVAIGGRQNNINSGDYSQILGGLRNNINGTNNFHCIINSQECNIDSSCYDYTSILNSNRAITYSRNTTIIGSYQGNIKNDCQYSALWGYGGSVVNPHCFQFSFDRTQVNKLGLQVTTVDAAVENFVLGSGVSTIKDFRLEDNQVSVINATVVARADNNNVMFFEKKIYIKTVSNSITILNSSSNLFDVVFKESGLDDAQVEVSSVSNRLVFKATGVPGRTIVWSLKLDTHNTYYA